MKVCPTCKRIYEDTKQVCPHDNTPLQTRTDPQKPDTASKVNPPQTDPPKLDSISHLVREAEQQRLQTQRTVLRGVAVCGGVVLLLLLGGSPWMGVHSPSSDSQTETVVAVNEQPASPTPAQPASGAAPVAQQSETAPPDAATQPKTAKTEPAPERAVTAQEPESAPEPQAAAEQAAPTPEPESAPTPKQPEHKATALHPTLTPAPEKRVTPQAPVRVAGQEKKTPGRVRAEAGQAQSAPPAQKPQMHARPEQKKPSAPMVWIYKTKTATPLLSTAQTGASVVKQLKSGEQLRVVGAVGDYFEVRSSGEGASSAYVHPKDVTLVRVE